MAHHQSSQVPTETRRRVIIKIPQSATAPELSTLAGQSSSLRSADSVPNVAAGSSTTADAQRVKELERRFATIEAAMITQLEIDNRRRMHTSMMEAKMLELTVQVASLEEVVCKMRGRRVYEPLGESLAKL